MSAEPPINKLIEQLRRIRIQEARIIDQIERATIREEETRREQRARRAERTQRATHVDNNWLPTDFQIGDRVRITNGVKSGQTTTATVTKVNPCLISIVTDDGTHTSRARRNLESL